jgi:hypothetical protein
MLAARRNFGSGTIVRNGFSSSRHLALGYWWSMIFSENRYTLFGIMLLTDDFFEGFRLVFMSIQGLSLGGSEPIASSLVFASRSRASRRSASSLDIGCLCLGGAIGEPRSSLDAGFRGLRRLSRNADG